MVRGSWWLILSLIKKNKKMIKLATLWLSLSLVKKIKRNKKRG